MDKQLKEKLYKKIIERLPTGTISIIARSHNVSRRTVYDILKRWDVNNPVFQAVMKRLNCSEQTHNATAIEVLKILREPIPKSLQEVDTDLTDQQLAETLNIKQK